MIASTLVNVAVATALARSAGEACSADPALTITALSKVGLEAGPRRTDIETLLRDCQSTSYPALVQALLFLLRDTRLSRPVFLDDVVSNYEEGQGNPPHEMGEVDLGRLRKAVLQAFNSRHRLSETAFGAIEASRTILFSLGSAVLDARAKAILDSLVESRTGSTAINAIGHADTLGPAEFNQKLSIARAEAVAGALVARGVPRNELSILGCGENEPAVPTADGIGESRNRRVAVNLGGARSCDADHFVASQEVGVIPGQSDVTSAGEYRYTLPISVPAGRAGVQPELSLQYASRAGDGRLGVGWGLVGLPEVRRCAWNRATEGRTDGVQYGSGDRFCLDGRKLVVIRGAYGGHESEYRTEATVFARIVSYVEDPQSPGEPSRFRIWTKDGRILDFGGPFRTSRIVAGRARATGFNGDLTSEGLRTVVWALQSMSDRVGNRMSVIHRQTIETRTGEGVEYWPEQISYVRQGEEDTRQERRITFEYDARPDPSFEYSSGVRFNNTRRLRAIITTVAEQEIGRYRLDYQTSGKTGKSLLTSVRRCDGAGHCLSAKQFQWDIDLFARPAWVVRDAPVPDILPLQSAPTLANRMIVADLNSDGRDDMVYQVPGRTSFVNEERVRLSEGETMSAPKRFTSPFASWDLLASRAVDLENDGLTEILAYAYNVRNQVGWHLLRPQGDGFVPTGTFIPAGTDQEGRATNTVDFADADGDGRLDLLRTDRRAVRPEDGRDVRRIVLALNSGSGFGTERDAGPFCGGGAAPRVADVNNDGRSEWVVNRCGSGDGELATVGLTADGTGIVTDTTTMNHTSRGGPGLSQAYVFIDINGDQLRDALYLLPEAPAPGQPANFWKVRWNTGNGFSGPTLIPADHGWMLLADAPNLSGDPAFDSGIRVADFDGDGREDVAKFSSGICPNCGSSPRELRIFYSRGDRFASERVGVDPGGITRLGWGTAQVGDFDGDGMPDLTTARERTIRLAGETTEVAPALASHNGRLVYGWKGAGNDDLNVLVSENPQEGFLHKLTIPDESDHAPALASHDGRLFMAWKGHDDHVNLMFSEDNGATFVGKQVFDDDTTDRAPALASHNGRLFIAWRGSGNENLNVAAVSLQTDASGAFSIGEQFEARATLGELSSDAPALASHRGRLFLAWKGFGNEEINVGKVEILGNTAGGFRIGAVEDERKLAGEKTDTAPALASHNNRLFVSWKLAGDEELNMVVSSDGGATFAARRPFSDSSDHAPAAVSHAGGLYFAWKGSNNEDLNLARVTLFANTTGGFGIEGLEQLTGRGAGPQTLRVILNTNLKPDLMMAVEDERVDPEVRRASETVSYLDGRSSSWGATQHEPQIACTYPQRCVKRGIPVVRALGRWSGSEPTGSAVGFNWNFYTYTDARADFLGRGFLGFGQQTVVDETRAKTVTLRFDHQTRDGTVYPFAGRAVAREEVVAAPGLERTTRSTTEYELRRLDGGLTFVVNPRVTHSTVHEGLASPVLLQDDALTQEWDDFGNETRRLDVTQGGLSSELTTRFNAGGRFERDWLISLPAETATRVGQFDPARTPLLRTTRYSWDDIGQLLSAVIEPDHPELRRTVTFEYASGLIRKVTSFGTSGSRTVAVGYDEDEVHPRRITNALGHTASIRMHAGLDVPLVTIDPNGVMTRFVYDGFGRLRSERSDDGRATDIDYAAATTPLGDTEIRVTERGAPRRVTEYDEMGRPIFHRVEAFDGRLATTHLVYDHLGRVIRETRPGYDTHPLPPSPHATLFTYDLLDRVTSVTAPDNATVRIRYAGRDSFTTDPVGNVVRTTSDPNGRIVERADMAGLLRKSSYRYGDFGALDAVEHSFQPPVRVSYDRLGRMTRLEDPGAGVRTFTHNEFDELTSETNALGQVTHYRRDVLGRVVERRDSQGRGVFTWDAKPFAIGKPIRSRSPDGIVSDYSYDSAGRISDLATVVDGVTFRTRIQYDEAGRIASRGYPVLGNPFDLVFDYAPTGYLRSVRPANGDPFFTVEARAADGQLERSRTGNGLVNENAFDTRTGRILTKRLLSASTPIFDLSYSYDDPRGLVSSRSDNLKGISETFSYDDAERLFRYVRQAPSPSGAPVAVRTDYGYDIMSNLTTEQRDGVVTRGYEYSSAATPRALTKLTSSDGTWTFAYDAAGRQIEQRLSPSGTAPPSRRRILFTPFDLPERVDIGNGGSPTHFRYTADRRRVLQNNGQRSIVTIDGVYEARRKSRSSPISQIVYVPGEGGVAAQVELDANGQPTGVAYYHQDAIASVQAVSRSDPGALEKRFFYEPFGGRVTAAGEPLPNAATGHDATDVRPGFAGHEHDDALGLIDMNGRVYDPGQRRFLTPDPVSPYGELIAALGSSLASAPAGGGPVSVAGSAATGGVKAGSSDASGFQPAVVGDASSPSRSGATPPPGSTPTGAAVAPARPARSAQWESLHPYSYARNNPLNYTDPSGFTPVFNSETSRWTIGEVTIEGKIPYQTAVSHPDIKHRVEHQGRLEGGDAVQFGKGMANGITKPLGLPTFDVDPDYAGAELMGTEISQNLVIEATTAGLGKVAEIAAPYVRQAIKSPAYWFVGAGGPGASAASQAAERYANISQHFRLGDQLHDAVKVGEDIVKQYGGQADAGEKLGAALGRIASAGSPEARAAAAGHLEYMAPIAREYQRLGELLNLQSGRWDIGMYNTFRR
ncbi:FG-GAP-like repeat-containing protein [Rhizobium mongolense]|uniref:FG-GAP-like repeat-containing protein n=1 Tax=Rhizobium mongolense TaxID=57676 RepID=UPI0034A39CD0